MPKYVYCTTFDAPDSSTANSIASDMEDKIGSFQQGSTPNGITGVTATGGGVVQVA
jgi:hypothetical protein